jgi:hypothetical protein
VSRISATDPVPRVRYQYAVGLVVAAVASIALPRAQEPPATTGAAGAGAGAGACGGCCRPPLALDPSSGLLDSELAVDGRPAEAAPAVLWPWKDFAAASEIAPESTTAHAISHRLIRLISSKPAFLALTAVLRTSTMIARWCKRTLRPP